MKHAFCSIRCFEIHLIGSIATVGSCRRRTFIFKNTLESHIDEILPLADEYEVKCVLQKCEHWLLTQFELKEANLKVSPHYQGVDSNVSFLMKCLYYGERYSLVEFYKKCSTKALPYKLQRYKENEHYQMLPESRKLQLVEDRLLEIERRANKSRQSSGVSTDLHECSSSLFLW